MKNFIFGVICLSILSSTAFAKFVGISKEEFSDHYRSQSESFWCWASSAEMVLSYQGVKIPQNMLVLKAKGVAVNQTGNFSEILKITNDVFKSEIDGNQYIISGQFVPGAPFPTVLYNQLQQKKPVILAYQNNFTAHAVVLTGIDATITPLGVMINKLYVFDPFPYQQSMDGFGRTYFEVNKNKIYNEYIPIQNQFGAVYIPNGQITGVILINGSILETKNEK